MKNLHLDKEEQIDLSERYLWALSFSSQPNPEVTKDLVKKYTKLITVPEKIKETLILTIASMAQKLLRSDKSAHLEVSNYYLTILCLYFVILVGAGGGTTNCKQSGLR